MCLFKTPKPKGGGYTPGVAPIQDTDTSLPTKKDLVKDDKPTDVTYGGKSKKEGQTQKAQGARSLAINLPNATQKEATTGGLGGVGTGRNQL